MMRAVMSVNSVMTEETALQIRQYAADDRRNVLRV